MLPDFLIPESIVREAGTGPVLNVETAEGSTLILTLAITRIIEQESLDIEIHGSADGAEWGPKALVAFPQKFYCGTYQILLDLSLHPEVKFVRAKWAVQRWGKGEPRPLFGFYLFARQMQPQAMKAATDSAAAR